MCRVNTNRSPFLPCASAMNRAASRVISTNPVPRVSIVHVAVAMISAATLVITDNGNVTVSRNHAVSFS